MMCTAESDMANSVDPSDIDNLWVVCSTYHTVLKATPGAAIFGQGMLFDIPFIADWTKIGDYRQHQTDHNTSRENMTCIDWDFRIGDKVLVQKDGTLCKGESKYVKDPWTTTQVHMNGTIRIQCRPNSERLDIRQATPFLTNIKHYRSLLSITIHPYAIINICVSFHPSCHLVFSFFTLLCIFFLNLILQSWGQVT
jgi:hypothetical protein